MRLCRFAVLLMFGCLSLDLATTVADDKAEARRRVEDLIRGLDGSTLAERSRAERQILELGTPALSLLPPSELIETASAREAVRRIRVQLERQAARESSAASVVTLMGDRTTDEVLAEIARQTKNRIELTGDDRSLGSKHLQTDWDKKSFWDCLNDLCHQEAFDWKFDRSDSVIVLGRNDPSRQQPLGLQTSGPFQIVIDTTEVRPVIGDETQRIVRVAGRISAEPRLRPLFLSMNSIDLVATVDNDLTLAAWNPDAKYEFPVSGSEAPVRWDFRLPKGAKAMTLSIRGRMNCQIAVATERVLFDQKSLVRGTIRRRGGVSVRLRQVSFESGEPNKLNGNIGITVNYDTGGPAFESHRSWIFHNAAYVETPDGLRTNFADCEVSQQTDGAVAVDYRWKQIDAPFERYRFVYEAPTLITDVPVEMNLQTIPIQE